MWQTNFLLLCSCFCQIFLPVHIYLASVSIGQSLSDVRKQTSSVNLLHFRNWKRSLLLQELYPSLPQIESSSWDTNCSMLIANLKQGQAFQNRVRKSLHIASGLFWSPAENYGNFKTLTCTQYIYIEHFWKHTSSSLPSSLIIFATFHGKLKIANLCWVMQTCFQVQSSPPQWPIMIRPMTLLKCYFGMCCHVLPSREKHIFKSSSGLFLHMWRVASMSFNLMPASVASLTRTLLQSFIKLKSWFEIERL